MSKTRITYKETFKKDTPLWQGADYPKVPHISEGFKVIRVDLLAQGTLEVDGKTVSFSDVRLFAEEL